MCVALGDPPFQCSHPQSSCSNCVAFSPSCCTKCPMLKRKNNNIHIYVPCSFCHFINTWFIYPETNKLRRCRKPCNIICLWYLMWHCFYWYLLPEACSMFFWRGTSCMLSGLHGHMCQTFSLSFLPVKIATTKSYVIKISCFYPD